MSSEPFYTTEGGKKRTINQNGIMLPVLLLVVVLLVMVIFADIRFANPKVNKYDWWQKMHNLDALDALRALLIERELQIKYTMAAKGLDMENMQQILKYFRPTD